MTNTIVNQSQITWSPQSGDPDLRFLGPSHYGLIKKGDNNAAQIYTMGMGSVLNFGSTHQVGFSIKCGTTAGYYSSNFLPQVQVDNFGRIKLFGTASLGGKSLTISHFVSGKPSGDTMYMVMDITNNTAGSLNLTPTLIMANFNLQNHRGDIAGYFGKTDTDVVAWDNTNKFIEVTTPEISNMYLGIRACNSVQHYHSQTAWRDINGDYLGAGNLPDSIGTLGTSNYIWSQHGETATPTPIAAGATGRFVWAVAYKATQAAIQTAMAALSSEPTSDLSTEDGYHIVTGLSLITPGDNFINKLLSINQARSNTQAYSQVISSRKNIPAGSYTFTFPFARDGYYSVKNMLQVGGESVVSDEYQLFKANESGNHSQKHEIAQYCNASGTVLSSGTNGSPGDQDSYQILKAYEYYIATQDATFLSDEISTLNNIATYLITYYNAQTKWSSQFPGAGAATYLDGGGNITGGSPMHDPVMSSLVAYTLQRLAELNIVLGNTATAAIQQAVATSIINGFSNFWNTSTNWLDFNRKTDGTQYTNKHIAKIDAAIWGILSSTYSSIMATQIADTSDWWDSTLKMFREMPSTDALYDANSYWYGPGWNLTDFKAVETVLRFGTSDQAKTIWKNCKQMCHRKLDELKGFMAEKYITSGVFGFSIGAMQEMIVRGLFGIDTHTTYFTISPNTYKIGLGTWKLTNLKMGNQTYTVSVSGVGPNQKTYAGGVLQSSNQINYGGNTTISIVFSGRASV